MTFRVCSDHAENTHGRLEASLLPFGALASSHVLSSAVSSEGICGDVWVLVCFNVHVYGLLLNPLDAGNWL